MTLSDIIKTSYFKIIIFIIIGFLIGFLIPKFSNSNKDIKNLEIKNKELEKNIDNRNIEYKKLENNLIILKNNNQELIFNIELRDKNIVILQKKIDSINILINSENTIITKIKNEGYEEINNVDNWNTDERMQFFTEFFKTKNN